MKNSVTIRMGASRWDVFVRGADGKPVQFDLYRMDKNERRNFHREFMKTIRQAWGKR